VDDISKKSNSCFYSGTSCLAGDLAKWKFESDLISRFYFISIDLKMDSTHSNGVGAFKLRKLRELLSSYHFLF
jgi:hypothetical protein